jgi:predicted transcriptional regulator
MITTDKEKLHSERFEVAFNRIHEVLKKLVRGHSDQFVKLLNTGAKKHQMIETYQDDLQQYAKLRNAMVHDKTEIGYYIAEPHSKIVDRIEKIAEVFTKPKYALKISSKPTTYDYNDSIQEVIQGIKEFGYSQYPIYKDGECIGLLNAGTIVNWMAENVVNSIVDLSDIKVSDIFRIKEKHPIAFAPKSIDIFQVEDIYEEAHKEKQDLEVVIITENGKNTETPLGIVTAWDLIEIDYTVDV